MGVLAGDGGTSSAPAEPGCGGGDSVRFIYETAPFPSAHASTMLEHEPVPMPDGNWSAEFE
jgi:hypothetical protein